MKRQGLHKLIMIDFRSPGAGENWRDLQSFGDWWRLQTAFGDLLELGIPCLRWWGIAQWGVTFIIVWRHVCDEDNVLICAVDNEAGEDPSLLVWRDIGIMVQRSPRPGKDRSQRNRWFKGHLPIQSQCLGEGTLDPRLQSRFSNDLAFEEQGKEWLLWQHSSPLSKF